MENVKVNEVVFVPIEEIGSYLGMENNQLLCAPMLKDGSMEQENIGEVEDLDSISTDMVWDVIQAQAEVF